MTKFLITTEHGTQIHLDTEKRTVLRKHSGDHPYFHGDYSLKYVMFMSGSPEERLQFPLKDGSSWKSTERPIEGESMFFKERGLSGAYYQSTTVVSIEEIS